MPVTSSAPSQHRRMAAPHVAGGRSVILVMVCSLVMLVVMADTVAATIAMGVLAAPPVPEVVLPGELAHKLGVGGLPWLATSFLVPFAAFLCFAGQLADRLGHRFVLGAGAALFTAATAGMLAAPTWLVLLSGRAAQAGGAALMVPA
ncbi:MFS transporter, partial [Nonomuraea fuscirosea]